MFENVFVVALVTLFTFVMLAVAASDLRALRISNQLVVALLVGWPAFMLAAGLEPAGWLGALLAGATVLLIGFFLFGRGWVGAGDVKLAAATALWLGPTATVLYVICTAVLGGLIASLLLLVRGPLATLVRPRRPWTAPAGPVPYGLALAGAAMIVFIGWRVPAIV